MKTLGLVLVLSVVGTGLIAAVAAAERSGKLPCCASAADVASAKTVSAPLVCSLTDADARTRREEVRALLVTAAKEVEETGDGYTVTFEKGHGTAIAEFIELERACCAFFEFTLRFPANDGPITLAVTGPPGSKAFSSALFEGLTHSE